MATDISDLLVAGVLGGAVGSGISLVGDAIRRRWSQADATKDHLRSIVTEHTQWRRGEQLRVFAAFSGAAHRYRTLVADADGKADETTWPTEWRPQFVERQNELDVAVAEVLLIDEGDTVESAQAFELEALHCMAAFMAGRPPNEDPEAFAHMRQLGRSHGDFLRHARSRLKSPFAVRLQTEATAAPEEDT